MHWISTWFLRIGALAALAGMGLGFFMAVAGDHSQTPLHAHINLIGWVSMMLYGLFYRSIPEATQGLLPRIQFVLSVARATRHPPRPRPDRLGYEARGAPFAGAGAILTIVGILIFLVTVFRWTRPRTV